MNFFKLFLIIIFLFFVSNSYSDNHSTELSDGVKEIVNYVIIKEG